jgi:hypothetical protein
MVRVEGYTMHVAMPELELFTRVEAARRCRLAPGTLKRLAAEGRGPRYSRTGDVRGRCLYAASDLIAWLEDRKQTPRACRGVTSEATGG